MDATIWILLMMWSHDFDIKDGVTTRTEAKYLAFNSEQECENKKKEFIISRINADAKRGKNFKDERQFSAGCNFVTIKAQPK